MMYKEFLKIVDQTYNNFNWRYGQTIMNVLHGFDPKKYREFMLAGIDCYYDDQNVKLVLHELQSAWKN